MKKDRLKLAKIFVLVMTLALMLAPMSAFAQGGGDRGSHKPPPPPRPWQLAGTLTAMPDEGRVGEWAIDEKPFQVTEQTRFDEEMGELTIGAHVQASGVVRNGQMIAMLVRALPLCEECPCGPTAHWRITGNVDAMPADGLIGDWLIAGQAVIATDETAFRAGDAELAVDVLVVSSGVFDDAGNRVAKVIGVLPQGQGDHHRPGAGWQLLGEIQSMPESGLIGDWVVAGQSFTTTERTDFGKHPETFAVGATLQAVGFFDDTGVAVAHRLNAVRVGDGDCPNP